MNKFTFTLYNANTIENCKNCEYPNKIQVFDADSLRRAVRYDYVGVELRNNYRKKDNFLSSDCLIFDLGNTKSDNNLEWKTPEDVAEAFPDVAFAIHYSKNNGCMKGNETARPRFRVIFPITSTNDVKLYLKIKRAVYKVYTDHCKETNSFQRHSSDFKTEMEKAGYRHVVANGNHRYFRGITLKDGGNNASI